MYRLVTLQESGYKVSVDLEDYLTYGDNPLDYSLNVDDFVFFSKDYALSCGMYTQDELVNWPDDLPVWEYRPC